ncbi:FUSC family protein [Aureimonas altamirensis]|uniref:FUSC family protein n=1 Tax=Aureimonas altamirensis TaxID=370622 RepID=UPI001E43CE5C|nr:FUSC family protein [Aureimonas altamirensis]UHD44082.1 FUSC family protein [Aureimonas altamirensis]
MSSAWRDAAASAVAAALAWVLSVWLLGHPHPVFAAISAIVCLSPGLPSHGKQAVGLMLGVATGILIAEAALLLPEGLLVPEGLSLLRLGLATFFAILIAASFGQAAVVPIQAGVSAVLVLAIGPATTGAVRMEDVAIGVVVGLVFSQILLTPDPVRQIDTAADDLFLRLASGFRNCVAAAEARDARKAEAALQIFSSAHDSLIALGAGIDAARYAARWSLRGRLVSRTVSEMASHYDRHAIRLYACALLFAEAFADAMRKDDASSPEVLSQALTDIAARCARIAEGGPASERQDLGASSDSALTPSWRRCVESLGNVADVLVKFETIGERPSTQSGITKKSTISATSEKADRLNSTGHIVGTKFEPCDLNQSVARDVLRQCVDRRPTSRKGDLQS